jgi:serine/threonine protein kinase
MTSSPLDLSPAVPGYLVGARLGAGSSGSVWRAKPLRGGREVAVKVLRAGPDAERELAVLQAVQHPHVVRLQAAVVLDDQRVALVFDLVDGGTLGSVVAQRGHLSPGEVVTVFAPLADALADLHADGLQHGDLAPGNVLFDRTGRPVLADLGTPRITGEPRDEVFGTAGYVDPVVLAGGSAGPASDVYGLGALAWLALTGAPPESMPLRAPLAELAMGAPPALIEAVESAVDPDPVRRPAPAAFAAALQAASQPVAVWLPGAGPDIGGLTHRIRALANAAPAAATGGRRRALPAHRHRAWLAATGVAAVVLLCTGWWLWPGWGGGREVAPAATKTAASGTVLTGTAATGATATGTAATGTSFAGAASPPASNPPAARARPAPATGRVPAIKQLLTDASAVDVVRQLSLRRAQLFAQPSRSVDEVAARGSPAAATDAAALRVLRAQKVTYRGLRISADQVRLVESAASRAVVRVRTSTTGYDVIDARGITVTSVPPAAPRDAQLVLVRGAAGWRVYSVNPR